MSRIIRSTLSGFAMALIAFNALAVCTGRPFNPITDANWNNMFPMTTGGISVGANINPPLMHINAVCVCPSHFGGVPSPGTGLSYWEPVYMAEVAKDAGCMSTLGGIPMLGAAYYTLNEASDHSQSGSGGASTRLQVHWYEYPVFTMMNMFADVACTSKSGFALGYITELDPTHQESLWASILSPEGALFANPIGELACIPDAVMSTVGFPIEALFWCAGTNGFLYPLSGVSQTYKSNQSGNMHILAKFVAKMHRVGGLMATIGPTAQCFSTPMPIWIKSQYRIDPVWPIPVYGLPINFGQHELMWGALPPANFPTGEDSAYLIWVGKQCCLRL